MATTKKNSSKWLLILAFVTILYCPALGQEQQMFSGNASTFPTELADIINTNDKETELYLEQFGLFWSSDSIDFEQKESIIELAGLIIPLVKENKKPLLQYIKIVATFFRDSYANKQYSIWNKAAQQVFKSEDFSLINLVKFINITEGIIYHSYINATNTFIWKSSVHPSYQLHFDSKLTVTYNNINLVCTYKKDSIFIKNTSGIFDTETKVWSGNGGKITWIRSDYSEDEIFAEIGHEYSINLTKNSYSIDSVMFTNKDYFNKPNLGTIIDKLLMDYKKNTIEYPEFQSYDNWFKIDNLFKDVNYEGGFTMRGSQLIGTGSENKLATIIINRKGQEILRAEGSILVFQRSILNSDKASVKFKFGKDSLYHTGLSFNYNNKSRLVTIAPTDKLTTQSPIHSSYHKMSIWFNQLTWNIDSDKLIFSGITGSANGIAQFESTNFFNEELFDDMLGPNDRHPLFALWTYSNKTNSKDFLSTDFAVYLRKPVEQVKIEMMRIAKQGYILYDFSTDIVKITDKLTNAIKARHKTIDYDVIKFSSHCDSKTPNAILNVDSLDLKINGIDHISVSQSQNVFISPRNNTIVMHEDRNFDFAGILQAGLFKFVGENFHFDYNDFLINLKDVDIVQIDYQINQYDNQGRRLLSEVTSTLERITGYILIDKPNNKSGLKKNPEYPIFNSTKSSYVYYDNPHTYNGIYKRDSIYFKIYPFSYNNLNNFEKEDMVFKGIFYSKNILAPIEDSLILRPDNSLGFIHYIPEEGFAIYEGKGYAFNQIDVSDRGILVNGKINYITSTTSSKEMVLFPDSMITQSDEFTIQKRKTGIEFPEVIAHKHKVRWLPKSDKLFAYKGNEPFIMFENQAKLSGDILLEPLGLTGNGSIILKTAQMNSKKYEFNADDYSSPAIDLNLLNPISMEVSFSSNNIKSYISFADSLGTFEKNDKSILANLIPLQYNAHLDKFGWDMESELTLITERKQEYIEGSRFYSTCMYKNDSSLNGSLFYSVKYGEDSLNFISSKANYSTKNGNLKAENVEHIITADAIVIPDNKKIEVSPEKRLHLLKNAVVNANIDSNFHRFYNAEISIQGRKLYGGNGFYDYIDELDSIQTIHFSHIKVDSAFNTYAESAVTESDNFTLSPNFMYFGKIRLYAPNKFLQFNGYTKPVYSCSGTTAQWFNFSSDINPDNILIPVSETVRSQNLAFLTNGSVVREDTIKLYGGFFQKRYDYADKPMVVASGFLTFNNKNRRFIIAPLLKIENPDTLGNSVSLQKDYCHLYSEGSINLPINLGQVKIANSGSIIHKLESKDFNLDMVSKFNFFFNDLALTTIANELNQMAMLPKVDLSRKIYKKALYDFVSPEDLSGVLLKQSVQGSLDVIPKGLESTITFADIKMTWDPIRKSFVSKGKLGIGSIGNVVVNKYVDGYVEIFKRRSGDVFNLYIHISDDKYYGFVYTKSTMQVVSSNVEFLNIINLLKSKDTRLKTKAGQPAYKFLVGTKKEVEIVKSRFSELKYGIKPSNSSAVQEDVDAGSEEQEQKEE